MTSSTNQEKAVLCGTKDYENRKLQHQILNLSFTAKAPEKVFGCSPAAGKHHLWLCCHKTEIPLAKKKHRTNFLLQLHLLMQPLAADMPGKESSYETMSLNKINKNIILHDFYAVQRMN